MWRQTVLDTWPQQSNQSETRDMAQNVTDICFSEKPTLGKGKNCFNNAETESSSAQNDVALSLAQETANCPIGSDSERDSAGASKDGSAISNSTKDLSVNSKHNHLVLFHLSKTEQDVIFELAKGISSKQKIADSQLRNNDEICYGSEKLSSEVREAPTSLFSTLGPPFLQTRKTPDPELVESDDGSVNGSLLVRSSTPASGDLSRAKRKRSYTFKRRKRRTGSGLSSLQSRRMSQVKSVKAEEISEWKCCKSLLCFKNIEVSAFSQERGTMLCASQEERKTYLTRMLNEDGRFYFQRRPVCASFLSRGFGFSKDLQRTVKCTDGAPAPPSVKRAPRVVNYGPQRELICEFLQRVLACSGSYAVFPQVEKKRLPFLQKKQVYELLLNTIRKGDIKARHGKTAPTFSYFISVWNEHFRSVRVQNGLECVECDILRKMLTAGDGQINAENGLSQKRRAHSTLVQRERASYLWRRASALTDSHRYCAIAIGGSKESSFGLPHIRQLRKSGGGWLVRGNVISLLDHGSACPVRFLMHMNQFNDLSNVYIEIIHRFINEKAAGGNLPRALLIDMSPATKQEEVRFLLAYLECLVAWRIFDEVKVSFGLPGHTHLDLSVDVRSLSEILSKSDILSIVQLKNSLESWHPQAKVEVVDKIANISGLLTLTKTMKILPSLSQFRFFRFVKSLGNYSASCYVRRSCMEDWIPIGTGSCEQGFITHPPDLRLTPPTRRGFPGDMRYLEEGLQSEEFVMPNETIRALQCLRAEVYSQKEDAFSWDLLRCLEGRASLKRDQSFETVRV